MPQTKTTPATSPPAAGAGSPAEAAAVAVAADATETERLVKLITAMGYPESEARLSLARCSNNVQRAVQLLVEGEDDDGESRQRRRSRRSLKKLRPTLLGDPCATNDAIVQLMREQSNARALAEMISGSGVQAMQLLLAEEDSEAEGVEEQLGKTLEGEDEEEEVESSDGEEPSPASSAESSPPSN